MAKSLNEFMNCPVCLEKMNPPIRQCEEGHSICGSCIDAHTLTKCPLCRANMTAVRNYQLEGLISSLKDVTLTFRCRYTKRGCKYILKKDEQETHHLECRHRDFYCEGKEFCGWDCEWKGKFEELIHHFKIVHKSTLEFTTGDCMRIDVTQDSTNVQAVDYQNGQQIFWFKNLIDVKEEKVCWIFQYVGLKKQTIQYYYEFEIHKGPIGKLKFTQICEWDGTDTRTICNEEKCVVVSFKTIKNFLNEKGEIAFRFRIMKVKKECGTTPNVPHPSMLKSSGVPLRLIPPSKNKPFLVSAASYRPAYCHPLLSHSINQVLMISRGQQNQALPPVVGSGDGASGKPEKASKPPRKKASKFVKKSAARRLKGASFAKKRKAKKSEAAAMGRGRKPASAAESVSLVGASVKRAAKPKTPSKAKKTINVPTKKLKAPKQKKAKAILGGGGKAKKATPGGGGGKAKKATPGGGGKVKKAAPKKK